MSVHERFWAKVRKTQTCWVWVGAKNGKGYGHFSGRSSHRISFEIANGAIPDGLEICHTCDNPTHLFAGTRTDNERDKVSKGRHHFQTNPEYAVRAAKIGAARPERAAQLAKARAARWPKESHA